MITMKAIAAISLTGLGAGTMSTDMYLASHATSTPPAMPVEAKSPPAFVPAEPPPSRAAGSVVTLEPVTIYASAALARVVRRTPQAAAPAQPRELVPCSDWRSLESGPAGHRVQSLCAPK
jgi:hypothetical protein